MVLTVPGRKSGTPRSIPITAFKHDGNLYVVANFPGGDWVANARAAGAGTVTSGRKTRRVRIVELGTAEAGPVLRTFAAKGVVGVRVAKRAGRVREGSPDEFAALAGQLPVFRLDG
jgi:deazaflavin-dependent oxidoreductase (nitroreductase family)